MARSDEVGLGLALKSTNRGPIGLAWYGRSVFAPYSHLDPLEHAGEALGFVTQIFSVVLTLSKFWIGFWSESQIRTTLPVG